MREMKHMLSINYIVLGLGCLDGYLKVNLENVVHAYSGREHVQQHHRSIRYGNSEEWTTFHCHWLGSFTWFPALVSYSKYNTYEKVKQFE